MNTINKIINGLKIFEKYNEHTRPLCASSKATLEVQEVEFGNITKDDREMLNSFGWKNKEKSPYLWQLI
jgi:hypothetical protein